MLLFSFKQTTIALLGILFCTHLSYAQTQNHSASPYFYVQGSDDGVEHFPLKSTEAKVLLNGLIATVKLTQTYSNNGIEPINASYIFPGSTQAAVNGMTMTIGDRKVVAKIKEKQAAKAIYQKAKKQGKSASLLSQQRPNVFSMDIANIMPGDDIVVELSYTEVLQAEDGEYEFVIPGVVGPRYNGESQLSNESTTWVANPYLAADSKVKDPVLYTVDIQMQSPIAIKELRSSTHKPSIDWLDKKQANIFITGDANKVGNRDFILNYYLQDNKFASGLSHYQWQGENYFMLVAEPPKRVKAEDITAREYLFVVDVSGSMNGFPLDVTAKVMEDLLSGLKPSDRFNILFFAGSSHQLSPTPLVANQSNIESGIHMMRNMRGGGGTNLISAMQAALAMNRVEGMSRNIVVITDGYISAEDAVFRLINENLNQSNVFAFGVGSSVNRHLIEGIAKAGQAESFVVTNQQEAKKHTQRFIEYISQPVLTGLTLSSPNAEIFDMQPKNIPDMLAERPILVMGKYNPNSNKPTQFKLKGYNLEGEKHWQFTVNKNSMDKSLPQLWARKRLEKLYIFPQSSSDEVREEITELGLRYNLLTKYTSFIAVDEVIRNTTGQAKNIKQPLPLPKGVSNLAVGAQHQMPEPEIAWFMLLLLAIWGYKKRKENAYVNATA